MRNGGMTIPRETDRPEILSGVEGHEGSVAQPFGVALAFRSGLQNPFGQNGPAGRSLPQGRNTAPRMIENFPQERDCSQIEIDGLFRTHVRLPNYSATRICGIRRKADAGMTVI